MNKFLEQKRDEAIREFWNKRVRHEFREFFQDDNRYSSGFNEAVSLLWPLVIAVKEAMPMIEEGYDVTALYTYDSNEETQCGQANTKLKEALRAIGEGE